MYRILGSMESRKYRVSVFRQPGWRTALAACISLSFVKPSGHDAQPVMNEHHAPKDDARFHQMSSAVPSATPMPVLKATTTTNCHVANNLHHSHAAAAAHVAAAAHAASAAQTMAYDPTPKMSDEGRPYHPVRKESDRRSSDKADYRKKSSQERKGSAKEDVEDEEDEERQKGGYRRRDSFIAPVNPEEVLKFLQDTEGGRRPIADVGTTVDQRDRLPKRRLKIHPSPATKDLYQDNERIKLNRSYKLRYNFMRKQGSVPSSMQDHMQRFKKPPFKRVWKPGACVENISDRLAKLSRKERKL